MSAELRAYKAAIRYTPITPAALHSVPLPALVSPKVDGETWAIVATPTDVYLEAPNGRIVSAAPVLNEARETLGRICFPESKSGKQIRNVRPNPPETGRVENQNRTVRIVGELFAARSDGKRPRNQELRHVLASGELGRLCFVAFDIVGDARAYPARLATLRALLPGGRRCRVVPTVEVSTPAELAACWTRWVEPGAAEGLVMRSGRRVWKCKPVRDVDALVMAYTLSSRRLVKSVVLGMMRADGTLVSVGSVSNMPDALRASLAAALASRHCGSGHRMVAHDGTIAQPVRPEVVVEAQVQDILTSTVSGPVARPASAFVAGEWRRIGMAASGSMQGAQLTRIRADKAPTFVDVRLSQVSPETAAAPVIITPKRHIVRRSVWTKARGGVQYVKKAVVIDNGVAEGWAPFTVYWCDYSPKRAEVLKRRVRPVASLEQAEALVERWADDEIKRGWEAVDVARCNVAA